jgi:prepilin-type N-terminal cleavage/methylation domain-containing protein
MGVCARLRNQRGFSLTEVMVTLAIVGIAAAVAIPSYNRVTSTARQAEAKTALTGIFATERAYALEFGTYTACLAEIGVHPEGGWSSTDQRYYAAGFKPSGIQSWCGRNGTTSCDIYTGATACPSTSWGYSAGKKVGSGGSPASISSHPSSLVVVTRDTFRARAFANMTGTTSVSSYDTWYIDQTKTMVNDAPNL